MDKLLENGFVFRNAYVLGSHSGAVCMPSRSMIQTGVSYFRKERTTPTLAETIKGAGYASIRSGKFGNNPNELDKPFDQHLDGNSSEGDANNIIRFIGENAGKKPLFLYMAVHEPHDPQFAAQEFYQMYLPEKIPLPQNFLPFHPFDNTLFVVAGDNGLSLGEHGLLGKQNLYEFGGMHVPLIFAGPGIKKGETKSFAYLFDVYPTMCEFAGIPIPAGLDAKSLAPVITGNQPKVHDLLFTAYKNCQRSIRNDRWKLICYPQINKTQLFDLQADPHEMKDLAVEPKGGEKKMKKRKKAK